MESLKEQDVLKPRYQQVSDDLLRQIREGKYPLGSRIPKEQELIVAYESSITTIRKAVQQLCDAGILSKRRALGTFVVGLPGQGDRSRQLSKHSPALRLGVLMPDLTAVAPEVDARHWQLNARRLNGIYQAVGERGCSVRVFDLSEAAPWEELDGVIIVRWWELEDDDRFDALTRHLDARLIAWGALSEYRLHLSCRWWVAENLEMEFFEAYRYLARNGVKRLLIVGPGYFEANPRLSAARYAAQLFSFDFEWLSNDASDRESAYRALQAYAADGVEPLRSFDTIFCTTDLQALGVMDYLLERGVRIPEELNLMGCDNIREAAEAAVPLTTIEFSGAEVGRLAVEQLLKAWQHPQATGETIFSRGKVVQRQSVQRRL